MGIMTYECKECDEKFKWGGSLKSHIAKVHRGEETSFVCQVCANTYKQRKSFKAHMRKAHGIVTKGRQIKVRE